MRQYFRPVLNGFIIIFCLWHMFAVAVYATPEPVTDRVATWIRNHLTGWVRPYMYATSQWQQWNMFSPDPMRQVVEYRLYFAQNGIHWPVLRLNRDAYAWWRRDSDMFLVRRGEVYDNPYAMWARYAQTFCGKMNLQPGTTLELGARYEMVPDTGLNDDWWTGRVPQWEEYTLASTTCREAGRAQDMLFP